MQCAMCVVRGAWCMVRGAGAWCVAHVCCACGSCAAIVRQAGLGWRGAQAGTCAHALVRVAALEGRAVAELRRVAEPHGDRRAPLLRTHARSDARRLGDSDHVERLQQGRGGWMDGAQKEGRLASASEPRRGCIHPPIQRAARSMSKGVTSSGCTRSTSSFAESTPIIRLYGCGLKRTCCGEM